jgi:membrane protease subunit HflK
MDQRTFGPSQFGQFKPPKLPLRSAAGLVAALIVGVVLWNLWFTVEPEEVGVVLRFGRYVRDAPPGLNFKLPDPIEKVIKVPVERQLKEEFGFRTEGISLPSRYSVSGFENESLMLTGDLNVAVVEWICQYRVKDPFNFLFRVRDVRTTFKDMNETVMREVVGDRTVNQILTVGRQEIADEAKTRLQVLCDQYETGITVDQIVLQDVNPPDAVKPSFNEVNQAQQEREKMINEARSEYNKAVPRARGEALRTVQEAEGYATERVNRAEGDAKFFGSILEAYERAPDVTRRRIYLETMEAVYPRIEKKWVLDKEIKSILPFLPLDREVKK